MPYVQGIKRMIERQQEEGKKEEHLKKKEVEGLFTERARAHIMVRGKVQGIFFRDFTKKTADSLGLTGWVKNTQAGTVEIMAEGEKAQLRKLIITVKKGPALAKVDKVDYEYTNFTGKFDGFYIKY